MANKRLTDPFIRAYYEFKKSIDFSRGGILPDLEKMIGYLLMGVPPVPADDDPSDDSALEAIDQRVTILKAVFTELNREAPEAFLDLGLRIYDRAAKKAKIMLEESKLPPNF